MNLSIKKIALMGLFTALGIVMGHTFIHIPNVELVTATIFIAGFLLGIKSGLVVGLITESIYSLFNPYGAAAPPLFIAQVVSMGLAGILGGLLGKRNVRTETMYYLQLGLAGFVATIIFAVLTTLSFVLFIDFSWDKLLASFIAGLGFYITHIISNTLIFFTLVPLVLKTLEKTAASRHTTAPGEIR